MTYPPDLCLCNTTTDNIKRITIAPTPTTVKVLNFAGPFFFLLCCNNAAGFMRPISPLQIDQKLRIITF